MGKDIKKININNFKNIKKNVKDFFVDENIIYKITDHKQSFGIFTKLHYLRKFHLKILISFLVGIFLSFNLLFFVQPTGLYTAGIAGIFQGLARVSKSLIVDPKVEKIIFTFLFYGGNFLINVPLFIFGYFKIGKKFALLSLVTLIVTSFLPTLINLIPGVQNWLNNLSIFGSVKPKNGTTMLTFQDASDLSKFPSLVLNALVAGLFSGFGYSTLLVISGSTGGTDFLSFYYSIKKNKSIQYIILYFNLIVVLVSILIGSFTPEIINKHHFSFGFLVSQNLVASLIMIFIVFLTYNSLFPKEKIVLTKIYGDKVLEIVNFLKKEEFHHSMTINKSIGGFSGNDNYNLEIICKYIELPKLLSDIKKVSPDAIIVTTLIRGMEGSMKFENSIR
ncbi:MAG: YitT family protein [Mycoplasmoidaceae bacterium]